MSNTAPSKRILEAIIGKRLHDPGFAYLIKWIDLPDERSTWHHAREFVNDAGKEAIAKFETQDADLEHLAAADKGSNTPVCNGHHYWCREFPVGSVFKCTGPLHASADPLFTTCSACEEVALDSLTDEQRAALSVESPFAHCDDCGLGAKLFDDPCTCLSGSKCGACWKVTADNILQGRTAFSEKVDKVEKLPVCYGCAKLLTTPEKT